MMENSDADRDRTTVHIHLALAHEACIDAFERYTGTSLPRWRIMRFLFESGGATQKEIAQRVGLDGYSVSRAVKPLEQEGFIERSIDPDDNRLTRVRMTRSGLNWYKRSERHRTAFLRHALHGLSEDELLVLERLLLKVRSNIRNDSLATYPERGNSERPAEIG